MGTKLVIPHPIVPPPPIPPAVHELVIGLTCRENGCAKSILTEPVFLVSIAQTPFMALKNVSVFLLPPCESHRNKRKDAQSTPQPPNPLHLSLTMSSCRTKFLSMSMSYDIPTGTNKMSATIPVRSANVRLKVCVCVYRGRSPFSNNHRCILQLGTNLHIRQHNTTYNLL